ASIAAVISNQPPTYSRPGSSTSPAGSARTNRGGKADVGPAPMVEIPAVRARCPQRQREPRGDDKQPHDRHERCAQNPNVAPRLAEKGASTVEGKSALQRVVPSEVEIVAEGRLLQTVLRRLADEDRRSRNGGEDRVAEGRRRAVGSLVGFELGIADRA